ncbi:MAG: RelA/spoT family protein [Anaerorhabdus sp.]
MKLELFDFIEKTAVLLQKNKDTYIEVEKELKSGFRSIFEENDFLLSLSSRIKENESLKEKIIRNKYYLKFDSPEKVIDYLPDLIGITLECRFINDENNLYKTLFKHFKETDSDFYQCVTFPNFYLNLSQRQPQRQRNGFVIYRMDGYIVYQGKKINYELQIKSLVHRFWGEIEHQVVYKNNQFILYDHFMKNILSSILDNLEVVDHQLETVYQQISNDKATSDEIGMGENGFKLFIAKSINDLVTIKMNEVVGFSTNFKKCSSILSQYVYIKDFMRSESPQYRMAEYIEHFNVLKESEFDFTEQIMLEKAYDHENGFCKVLGEYWEKILNQDYEWHIFFIMVFIIQPGNNIQDFTQFVEVVHTLIFTSTWMNLELNPTLAEKKDELETILARCLVKIGKIDIIHEENLFMISTVFKSVVMDFNQNRSFSNIEFETLLEKQLLNLF